MSDYTDNERETITITKQHVRTHSANSGGMAGVLEDIKERSHPNFLDVNRDPEKGLGRQEPTVIHPDSESRESQSSSVWRFKDGLNKNFIVLVLRFIISLIIIIFCIVQLSKPITADIRTLYVSILTGTVSSWSPSPFEVGRKNR